MYLKLTFTYVPPATFTLGIISSVVLVLNFHSPFHIGSSTGHLWTFCAITLFFIFFLLAARIWSYLFRYPLPSPPQVPRGSSSVYIQPGSINHFPPSPSPQVTDPLHHPPNYLNRVSCHDAPFFLDISPSHRLFISFACLVATGIPIYISD
ncbi:hypothetical protein F4774DRAFT_217675 [Daldinia eschscholtzii]|nr:hypothetical protein F4774DRAFT_217675 [Daldinia eschscholtzii]